MKKLLKLEYFWLIVQILLVIFVIVYGLSLPDSGAPKSPNAPLFLALLFPPLVFGAIVGIFGGHIVVRTGLYFMRGHAYPQHKKPIPDKEPVTDEEPRTADVLGYIERLVIFGAFIMGFGPQTVAGWVTLKTVLKWKGWEDQHDNSAEGRARFNIFLVGTSLSILSAVIGVIFALWLYKHDEILGMFTLISSLNSSCQKP